MDKKAKNILFKTYWKNGWIDDKDRKIDPADFEYAKSKGLMFDTITITHDQCIDEILDIANTISIENVAKAFLSSLSNRRLAWRSGIASFSIAKQLTKHKHSNAIIGYNDNDNGKIDYPSYLCRICRDLTRGISVGYEDYIDDNLNVLNFERIKWGGVRHGDLLYTLFDLKMFNAEKITEPTVEDINIFKKILEVIETSQEKDTPSKLEKRLSKIIKSTKNERVILIKIMVCIEILKPDSYDKPITNDWTYAQYWRGIDKYNQEAVKKYFGEYF
jgi:hypothetical protein